MNLQKDQQRASNPLLRILLQRRRTKRTIHHRKRIRKMQNGQSGRSKALRSERTTSRCYWTTSDISVRVWKQEIKSSRYVSITFTLDGDVFQLTLRCHLVYSIEEYLPGALLPTYESGKAALLEVLQTLGIIPKSGHSAAGKPFTRRLLPRPDAYYPPETSSARQANNDAKNALSSAESKLRNEEGELSKLFDPKWYGSDGAWKKLENTCLSKDTGEYTYSVCLFKGATQKSNKDGSSNNLGWVDR